MRIPIRAQLGLLVLFCSLLALMVLALATWFQSRDFVVGIRLSALALTASLKSAELSGTLLLYESQVKSVATRVLIQSALQRYQEGNDTNENWIRTQSDISGALANGALLAQAVIFPAYDTGNATALAGLVNVTSTSLLGQVRLPYNYTNGTPVYLGDPGLGYPPSLYPTLTYYNQTESTSYYVTANGQILVPESVLVLGPLIIDTETALLSATTAIKNNSDAQQTLGWLTVVVNASMIYSVRDSEEGLGSTGEVLIIGPDRQTNQFDFDVFAAGAIANLSKAEVKFILPPSSNTSVRARHSARVAPVNSSVPFPASSYPAVIQAWTKPNNDLNNAGSDLDTRNEQNDQVSVGYAQLSTSLVDWVLLVESSYSETVEPIHRLRNIVLITVFSVTGGLLVITFPIAHYSVAPIRALRAATQKTVEPYLPDDGQSGHSQYSGFVLESNTENPYEDEEARKEGFLGDISRWVTATKVGKHHENERRNRRTFRIPAKVPERKHFIHDELTDLTSKFNEMSDELTMQYQRLEERVKMRTAELEESKKIAEAANQSKTLFIANISHELKTPLNGILGLATVCMNEEDPAKIHSTLNTIYKSGDLLLHLLTDLLTFSKNEVGQQIAIDESEFRLYDLKTQLMPTFERQAREGQINLQVQYYGTQDQWGNSAADEMLYGPTGTGKVRDMCLWGDKNRILQVLMNFVSNSLKFTPPHGSVTVRIKCIGIADLTLAGTTGSVRKSSLASRKSKTSSKRVRTSDTSLVGGSDSENERKSILKNVSKDAKLSVNVGGGTAQIAKIVKRKRSRSPPPMNAKDLEFEFEVEDTGPGIPEDQQKKIFEPFVQGDLGLSKKYGGTGLGLSICAQLASLMGGELFLDSQVGRGSKFTMRIPLRYISERAASFESDRPQSLSKTSSVRTISVAGDSHSIQRRPSLAHTESGGGVTGVPRLVGLAQPYMAKEVNPTAAKADDLTLMKKAETEAAKSGSKVRVLVAEDNKINQEVVLRMLKLEDVYDVTIAKDGQEAFDKVRESMHNGQKFHLVFMDVQMPNVDGIQSTKMIRGVGFNAPIVALTAFAEKSNEDECLASGMDYFLAKPIRRPALKQVLKKYCTTIPEESPEGTTSPLPNGVAGKPATKEGPCPTGSPIPSTKESSGVTSVNANTSTPTT